MPLFLFLNSGRGGLIIGLRMFIILCLIRTSGKSIELETGFMAIYFFRFYMQVHKYFDSLIAKSIIKICLERP